MIPEQLAQVVLQAGGRVALRDSLSNSTIRQRRFKCAKIFCLNINIFNPIRDFGIHRCAINLLSYCKK